MFERLLDQMSILLSCKMDVVIACAICIGIDLQMSDPLENSYAIIHLYICIHVSMQQQFVHTIAECSFVALLLLCIRPYMYNNEHQAILRLF